jgi:cation:H+ antiporter
MFHNLSLWTNVAVFVGSAFVVWFAGTRLARYADAIAEKTGIGRELLGILLLGGVTSLPELAVGITASLAGTPTLSINDVLGSAAINVVILALADAAIGRSALTSTLASPGVLLQGVLGIVLLSLVLGAVIAGDVLVLGIGAWSWLMLAAYLGAIWMIARSRGVDSWVPAGGPRHAEKRNARARVPRGSLRRLIANTAAAGCAILVAGFLLARTGEAIAEQTALGVSFFGVLFLAMATSLPEVSTVLAAVRLRRYEMAIADVFGTNLFNVTIIVVVDALHPGAPVLVEAGRFAAFGALLAIVLTAIYLVGMIERRDRTVARMGIDSLAVLGCYAAGVVVLYQLR